MTTGVIAPGHVSASRPATTGASRRERIKRTVRRRTGRIWGLLLVLALLLPMLITSLLGSR